MIEGLCTEMALTRPEAFDEYVIFVVTNRGEYPGGLDILDSLITQHHLWPWELLLPALMTRPKVTFSEALKLHERAPLCTQCSPQAFRLSHFVTVRTNSGLGFMEDRTSESCFGLQDPQGLLSQRNYALDSRFWESFIHKTRLLKFHIGLLLQPSSPHSRM